MTKPLPLCKRKTGFWLHVNKKGPTIPYVGTPCWLWTGSVTKDNKGKKGGYGFASQRGHTVLAHRLAWEMANGPIPDGMCVLHSCDTRNCVRNDSNSHLLLGTYKDNMDDMYAKGRGPTGDKNGSRTRPDRRPWGDRNGSRIHPESRERGKDHWMHRMPDRILRGESNSNAKLTDAEVRKIIRLGKTGDYTQEAIGNRFGVAQAYVSTLIRKGRQGTR